MLKIHSPRQLFNKFVNFRQKHIWNWIPENFLLHALLIFVSENSFKRIFLCYFYEFSFALFEKFIYGHFYIWNIYCKNIYFWLRLIFVYKKSLTERFKPVFEYKVTVLISVFLYWIHKGYFVVKELVWNVCIKAFCYINII